MKNLDLTKFFRLYLPLVVFAGVFATYAIASNIISVNIIAGGVALLILSNLLLQNVLFNRILGTIFLLVSFFMLLALFDDIVDGEATIEYLFGFIMILFSITMSVLLIIGYNKQHKMGEINISKI